VLKKLLWKNNNLSKLKFFVFKLHKWVFISFNFENYVYLKSILNNSLIQCINQYVYLCKYVLNVIYMYIMNWCRKRIILTYIRLILLFCFKLNPLYPHAISETTFSFGIISNWVFTEIPESPRIKLLVYCPKYYIKNIKDPFKYQFYVYTNNYLDHYKTIHLCVLTC